MVQTQLKELRLVEWFWTFQGEGTNWGRRAFFVRVPSCNLHCSWCDTEFNKFVKVTEDAFLDDALKEPSRFAVLTGGEPAMNKQLPRIIELLKNYGFELAIETNGTFPIPRGIDFVTVSPKEEANFKVDENALANADEIKLIVDDTFNFETAKAFEKLVIMNQFTKYPRLTLSPEFNKLQINVDKIEDFIRYNPRWRISLQTHKFMGKR